jgi:lysyl-tRNA synthetase class 2
MDDAEELIADLCKRVHGGFKAQMGDHVVDFARPWPRFTVRELFQKHVGVDLGRGCDRERLAAACRERGHVAGEGEDWDDLFFKLWLNHVEPALPSDRPVIVHRYPPSQAALAVVEKDGDGTHWARRFEVYAGGLELANAFEELTDPVEQRARFEKDMALRERVYDDFEPSPLDEGFLQALGEGMPPSGGIALGVDRLVMLLAGEPDIDFTLWLKSASEESRSQSPGP